MQRSDVTFRGDPFAGRQLVAGDDSTFDFDTLAVETTNGIGDGGDTNGLLEKTREIFAERIKNVSIVQFSANTHRICFEPRQWSRSACSCIRPAAPSVT